MRAQGSALGTEQSTIVGEWCAGTGMRIVYGIGAGAFAALMAGLALVSVITPIVGAAPPEVALGAIVYGPVAYVNARLAIGSWRARVEIRSDGILVVGPWKTQFVELEHVEKFSPGRYGTSSAAVMLLRTGAGRLRSGYGPRNHTLLWATQRGGSVFTDLECLVASLAPLAAQMNNALEQARALNHQPQRASPAGKRPGNRSIR